MEANTEHFDEPGVRVGGQLHWLPTACTEHHTYLFVHEQRGTGTLKSQTSILKDFKGTAIHDCWSSYFNFESARHVLCGAHLLRELAGLMEKGSLWASQMHEFRLDLDKMPRPLVAIEEVRKHYHIILTQVEFEKPPPQPGKRGKPKQSTGRNLLNRLKNYEEGVRAFALEANVPFTRSETGLTPS